MIAADSADFPITVDQIVADLKRDPILVEQTMGSGDAAGTAKRLAAVARKLPFPTYVALVTTPQDDDSSDASAYLATAISRRIGKPGIYVVQTSSSPLETRIVGEKYDDTLLSLESYANSNAVVKAAGEKGLLSPGVGAETALLTATLPPPKEDPQSYKKTNLSSAQIADLAAREKALAPAETPREQHDEPARPWSAGKRWMVGTSVGVGALLLIQQSIRGWPGWRRDQQKKPVKLTKPQAAGPEPDLEDVRRRAQDRVTALAERLAATTDTSADTSTGTAKNGDLLNAAGLARDAAEPLLESKDLEEVVGALTLADTGLADLSRARGRRKSAYRCCFFNPLHGSSTTKASWRFGEADVDVPVCRACSAALRDSGSGRPDALRVGRRPYYERDDVWARTGFGSLVDDFASQVITARRGR